MRSDFAERFSECKYSSKDRYPRNNKKLRKVDEDGMPVNKLSMKKTRLMLTDNMSDRGFDISLLIRFLVANRNRPWNDVYSEICQQTDSRTVDGYQLHRGLNYLVEQNCFLAENGEVVTTGGYGVEYCSIFDRFYVHPVSGLLIWTQENGKKAPERHHRVVKKTVFEMDDILYYCHKGLWYRVKMHEVTREYKNGWFYTWRYTNGADIFGNDGINKKTGLSVNGSYWSDALKAAYGLSPQGYLWYATEKESANKKEIKKLKAKIWDENR